MCRAPGTQPQSGGECPSVDSKNRIPPHTLCAHFASLARRLRHFFSSLCVTCTRFTYTFYVSFACVAQRKTPLCNPFACFARRLRQFLPSQCVPSTTFTTTFTKECVLASRKRRALHDVYAPLRFLRDVHFRLRAFLDVKSVLCTTFTSLCVTCTRFTGGLRFLQST